MEQRSFQSNERALSVSDQSECNSEDAFAKTPIRPESDAEGENDSSSCSTSSSKSSPHRNEQGDKTYFHVWGDMLTCTEMSHVVQKAAEEEPKYVIEENEDIDPDVQKPFSMDTSLPCPLIQFGPIPKRRSSKPTLSELQGMSEETKPAAPESKPKPSPVPKEIRDSYPHTSGEGGHHIERCCDFSLVAAKNNARLKREEKLRRLERKRLVRY